MIERREGAARSFEEAARQDPQCAMCYWGLSLAMGPHINAPMHPDAVEPAFQALEQAQAHAAGTTEREQAYIQALDARYVEDPGEDRGALDRAYADAMRSLVADYPDDLDAATLFAESLMNLVPWNYWDEHGDPRAETVELVEATQPELAGDLPFLNNFLAAPTLTLVRFGKWDDILALPEPPEEAVFGRAIHHYARGLALAADGQLAAADEEADRLTALAHGDEAQALEVPEAFFPGATMLTIADNVLQARLARLNEDGDRAVALLEEAVTMQDALPYMEPPYWFASARLNLGETLLALDRPAAAEAVYRTDLEEYPNNGWALFGLAESLRARPCP